MTQGTMRKNDQASCRPSPVRFHHQWWVLALCLAVFPMVVLAFPSVGVVYPTATTGKPAFLSRMHVSATTSTNDLEQAMAVVSTSKKEKKILEDSLSWDWEHVVQQCWKESLRPIILFDGECNLCNGGVNFVLDMDTTNEFRFCSLTSKIGQSLLVKHGKDPEDRNSIVLVLPTGKVQVGNDWIVNSSYLEKSRAVMNIASKLEGATTWVKALTVAGGVAPVAVSDWFMQIIAENRYKVAGEYDQCRLDLDGEYEGRFLNDYDHEDFFVPQPVDAKQ